jgi:hypothetical protein
MSYNTRIINADVLFACQQFGTYIRIASISIAQNHGNTLKYRLGIEKRSEHSWLFKFG